MTAPTEYLTPYEHTRRALHHSIDRICDSWPLALEDANARGYPQGVDYNVRKAGSENTSVETAALNPSKAVAWLAELADLLIGLGAIKMGAYHQIMIQLEPSFPWRTFLHSDLDKFDEHQIRVTIRLANTACLLWPPTAKTGQTRDGVTVGQRGNQVELCVYCQKPVQPGKTRRIGIDSDPICKSPCWYAVTVSHGDRPRQKTG